MITYHDILVSGIPIFLGLLSKPRLLPPKTKKTVSWGRREEEPQPRKRRRRGRRKRRRTWESLVVVLVKRGESFKVVRRKKARKKVEFLPLETPSAWTKVGIRSPGGLHGRGRARNILEHNLRALNLGDVQLAYMLVCSIFCFFRQRGYMFGWWCWIRWLGSIFGLAWILACSVWWFDDSVWFVWLIMVRFDFIEGWWKCVRFKGEDVRLGDYGKEFDFDGDGGDLLV